MKNVFLEGSQICLRPFNKRDLNKWYSWFNDKGITKYSYHGAFPNTPENQKKILEEMRKSPSNLQLAVVLKKEKKLIGVVGIHKISYIHQYGDVSIVIGDKNYWGKGYAKEAVSLIIGHAFKKLNLHRITAGMVAENVGSYRIFKSLNFKKEGLMRKHKYIDGEFKDVITMGILKKEFLNQVKRSK